MKSKTLGRINKWAGFYLSDLVKRMLLRFFFCSFKSFFDPLALILICKCQFWTAFSPTSKGKQNRGADFDKTAALSIRLMPLCSVFFYLPPPCTFSASSVTGVLFLLQCRVWKQRATWEENTPSYFGCSLIDALPLCSDSTFIFWGGEQLSLVAEQNLYVKKVVCCQFKWMI